MTRYLVLRRDDTGDAVSHLPLRESQVSEYALTDVVDLQSESCICKRCDGEKDRVDYLPKPIVEIRLESEGISDVS